jgi:hypothetical protein
MEKEAEYVFADGSANQYVITPATLEYIPVKPEESSTGFYSGGKPGKVSISKEQYTSVKDLLEKARNKTEIHIPDRIKTSGMISKRVGPDSSAIIIDGHTSEMKEIEALLHKLLPTGK